jgi:hypothetical protein
MHWRVLVALGVGFAGAAPVAGAPPTGACPGPYEAFTYPQPPNPFFVGVDAAFLANGRVPP